ncbi:MAG: Xaa-Pro peptidase family protein [Acidimicrobiales bacterium]|jgi:Xaa-Pro aminopeptidase
MPTGSDRSDLAVMDVAGRVPRLTSRLAELGCDGLLVTNLTNIRYLTGFTGSAALLLVLSDEALLVSDGRYRDQAAAEIAAGEAPVRVEIAQPAEQSAAIEQAAKGLRRLGLEADDVTWSVQQRLAAALAPGTKLVAVPRAVEALRVVKDEGEIARIECAADIADVAFAQVKELLCEAPTEEEFAIALEFEMRRRGAEGIAFESIVASGPNGALPHARPSARRIDAGELVVVDFGAIVDGYRSDMTRTVSVGAPRPDELREILEAVMAAQRAGVRTVRAGVTGGEVDAACRESLAAAGLGDAFLHGTGHGVGLEVHEAPSVSQDSTDILEEGAVVTVEPGAYLYSNGGARIEDTLVVTATGVRLLTKSTKDYVL